MTKEEFENLKPNDAIIITDPRKTNLTDRFLGVISIIKTIEPEKLWVKNLLHSSIYVLSDACEKISNNKFDVICVKYILEEKGII